MREIKFRVWCKEGKEFLVRKQIRVWPSKAKVWIYTNKSVNSENTLEWCIETKEWFNVMQYAGLKDKNGKDIYEGDVVKINWYGDYEAEFPFIELYEAEAEWDIWEIIGNIYENPDLLNN